MKFCRTPLAYAASTLAVAAYLPSLPAHAQVAAAPAEAASVPATTNRLRETEPQQVVITASKRSQTASKVPFNVTAIGEEQLRNENITDTKKLLQEIDAIHAAGNSARFADSVTVRGLNISQVNANNLQSFTRSTLAYYLDDTPLPNLGYRIKDVARVETLLGPQGTLYGAGSLGGTLRFITNKPRIGETEARLNTSFYQVQGGELSNDTDAVFNIPMGTSFALRASLARLNEGGYTDRVSNPPWRQGADAWSTKPDAGRNVYANDDWQKVDGGRVSLLWKLTRDIEITFAYTSQDQLAHGTSGTSLLPLTVANARTKAEADAAWKNPGLKVEDQPCQPKCRYTDASLTPPAVAVDTILSRYEEYADRRFRLSSVDLDWNLGFANLHSSTSQFTDKRRGQADYASQGWSFYAPESEILGGYDLGASITSDRSAYMTFDNAFKGLSHETRLTSSGDGPLSWIAGLYHTRQDSSLKFSEVLPGMDAYINRTGGVGKAQASPLPDVGYSEDLGSKYRETAVFGEVGYRITPAWQVTLGARVFNYTDDARGFVVDYAGGAVNSDARALGGDNGKSYYKLNTAYQVNDNLLGYLTLSQGFRRGGTNGFKNQGTKIVDASAQSYQPDSTDNVEVGIKGYLLDRSLYLQTSLWRIKWNDPQTYRSQDVSGFPVNGTANGPNAHTQGFDISARYRLNDNWQFTYSAATSTGQFDETRTQCLYTNGTSCRTWSEGGILGGGPKWKHNLGVNYNVAVAGSYYVKTSLSARYVGKVITDRSDSVDGNADVRTFDAYTRYNASLGVSKDAWDASVWVQNLGNVRAQVSSQAAGLMGPRAIYLTPRTVGLNLSYRFF